MLPHRERAQARIPRARNIPHAHHVKTVTAAGSHRSTPKSDPKKTPSTAGKVLRFVPLGGFEEVGKNMMFFEYGDEILIIDAGLQFPEENTPGVDYIIPNVSYLEEHKKNVKGMIVTHGHYDHIGAIPHVLEKLGNPTIYTTRITKEIIAKRQGDYPNVPMPVFDIITAGDTRKISANFTAEFFAVTHNIPDGIGILLHTPAGKIVHPGEFKFDYDSEGNPRGLDTWEKLGKQGIHTLLLDSTGSEVPGWSVSERVVETELEKVFRNAKGRLIVAAFASLLDRLIAIIGIAEKIGRKVAISGYSMKTNFEITQNLGYAKINKGTIVPIESIKKYPDNKILILSTGAQGEPRASLTRIANGEHKQIKLKMTDTVVFSSSVIPGNEHSVQVIKDNLARQCWNIYHNKMLDIHSSGHAPIEELKTVIRLIKPRFFIPMHGHFFMRLRNTQHAQEVLGLPKENTVVSDNGIVIEIGKDSVKATSEEVTNSAVMVDGLGVGDVEEIVLRDRRNLAEEGMIVLIVTLDRHGRVIKNPDIISRGFIYLKNQKEFIEEIRRRLRSIIHRLPNNRSVETDYTKTLIRNQVGQFVYNKTKRRPMILPVIIEV